MTYEYICKKRHVTREQRPITAPSRQRCPKCRCKVRMRLWLAPGVIFKGKGWAKDGYSSL